MMKRIKCVFGGSLHELEENVNKAIEVCEREYIAFEFMDIQVNYNPVSQIYFAVLVFACDENVF